MIIIMHEIWCHIRERHIAGCIQPLQDSLGLFFRGERRIEDLFVQGGGVLKDYHKVTDIIPGDTVTVRTNKGDFEGRRVIITAGPWGPAIVKKLGVDLPFKVYCFLLPGP